MTRKIKFRAYDHINGEIINDNKYVLFLLKDDLYRPYDNSHTVMQSSGIQDMNSIEIHEGDIVKYGENSVNRYEVIFLDGGFKIELGDKTTRFIGQYSELWVLGNIYQNPELLK